MSTDRADRDMVDILVEDHRELEELFRRLESGEGTPEVRRQIADAMTAELVRHTVAEEMHLYPTARNFLDDGNKIADHEVEQHGQAEQLLKELESVQASDGRFDELVRSIVDDVRHHIEEEEDDLFPRLRLRCTRVELVDLGRKLEDAKRVAPTRPHPSAPDTPPANKLLAPGAGLVDRVRDALSGRATKPNEV